MPTTRIQIFVIADYGRGDPAFVEVYQYLRGLIPESSIENVYVSPLSTIQTGFWAYQLAINYSEIKDIVKDSTMKTYLFLNTAPRRDEHGPRKDNAGERLVYARLNNGLEMVGVLSGDSFSFVKPLIKELREIDVSNHGSQFRSRDIFPAALKNIVDEDYSILGGKVNLGLIPDKKPWMIAHVDGYGNMKLSTLRSEVGFKSGDKLAVEIAGRSRNLTYTDGIFDVEMGEMCMAPGSSGPREDAFLEICRRSGNAWKEFGSPGIGSKISAASLGAQKR